MSGTRDPEEKTPGARGARLADEQALVRAAQAGDPRAFEALIDRYFGMVYAIAFARLTDREIAEDLAQEVFLRVSLFLGDLKDARRFGAWVSRLTRNLAIDWLRRGQRASRLLAQVPLEEALDVTEDDRPDPRERAQREETRRKVHEAILGLPANQREMVMLRFIEEMRVEDIAAQMGVHTTTVRYHLRRALGAMRGTLEPLLRESAPALRARRRVAARTAVIVAAAAALSAAQKSALAGAAAAGMNAVEAKSAVSGVMGLIFALWGFIKSIFALLGAGGASMGMGKGIAIAVAAVAVAGGGTVYYVAQRNSSEGGRAGGGAPAAVVAPMAPALPPLEPLPPLRQWADWNEMARAYAAEHPENAGLARYVDALERFNTTAALQPKQQIDTILREGWNAPYPEIVALLNSQRPALDAAFAAAQSAPFTLPPTEDVSTPVPNFLGAQTLNKLMLVDARFAESRGDLDTALDKAVLAARLAVSLNSDNVGLIHHLIGVAAQALAYKTLEALLANPRTSVAAAQRTGAALHELAAARKGVLGGFRWESQCVIRQVQRAMQDPAYLARMGNGPEVKQIREIMGDFEKFRAESNRIWGTLLANYEKPAWERQSLGGDWVKQNTKNPILMVAVPNFDEALSRDEVTLAHLRLCQAFCALKMERADLLGLFPDPFTGEPLRATPALLYSLGPDRADQNGEISFDATNGTISAGDIFVRR